MRDFIAGLLIIIASGCLGWFLDEQLQVLHPAGAWWIGVITGWLSMVFLAGAVK